MRRITRGIRVNAPGIFLRRIGKGRGACVVISDGILRRIFIHADMIVGSDIAGQVVNLDLICAAACQCKKIRAFLCRSQNTAPCAIRHHGPALQRIAVNRIPFAAFLFLEDNSKHHGRIHRIAARQRHLRIGILRRADDVGRSRRNLRHGICAVIPGAVGQKQHSPGCRPIEGKPDFPAGTVSRRHFRFHQHKVAAGVCISVPVLF